MSDTDWADEKAMDLWRDRDHGLDPAACPPCIAAALREARSAALREAAAVAQEWETEDDISGRIRALDKEKP